MSNGVLPPGADWMGFLHQVNVAYGIKLCELQKQREVIVAQIHDIVFDPFHMVGDNTIFEKLFESNASEIKFILQFIGDWVRIIQRQQKTQFETHPSDRLRSSIEETENDLCILAKFVDNNPRDMEPVFSELCGPLQTLAMVCRLLLDLEKVKWAEDVSRKYKNFLEEIYATVIMNRRDKGLTEEDIPCD